jgi:hypothetical protein
MKAQGSVGRRAAAKDTDLCTEVAWAVAQLRAASARTGGQAPDAKQTDEIEKSIEKLTVGDGSAKDKRALMTTLFGNKYHQLVKTTSAKTASEAAARVAKRRAEVVAAVERHKAQEAVSAVSVAAAAAKADIGLANGGEGGGQASSRDCEEGGRKAAA